MRFLLVEDQEIYREGLKAVLGARYPAAEFLEAGSIEDSLRFTDEALDILILDYYFPAGSQLSEMDALIVAKKMFTCPIIVHSMTEDESVIAPVYEQGAGFVPKTKSNDVLFHAIDNALQGMISRPAPPRRVLDDPSPLDGLTERQRETLKLAVEGMTNQEIADALGIKAGTVKAHLSFAFKVLDVRNRTEASYYLQERKIDL